MDNLKYKLIYYTFCQKIKIKNKNYEINLYSALFLLYKKIN